MAFFIRICWKSKMANRADFRKYRFLGSFLRDFCENTSFHGFRHFIQKDISLIEKLCWFSFILFLVFGALRSMIEIWSNYSASPLETVIETMHHKTAQIAFPSIIVCDMQRVDWSKALQLNASNLREFSNETKPAILEILSVLSVISFQKFEKFAALSKYEKLYPKLATMDISNLLLKVMRSCEDVFKGPCWWHGHQIDCCLIFELHKTSYGYCYSFNSDLSESSKKLSSAKKGIESFWTDAEGALRPRRTASSGTWTGLRFVLNTAMNHQVNPNITSKSGIMVVLGEPRSTMSSYANMEIQGGILGKIEIWGDRIYSTESLRKLTPSNRQCYFHDERSLLGLPYYLKTNCRQECYKNYTFEYCKCVPYFLFYIKGDNENVPDFPPCTFADLVCLQKHNENIRKAIYSDSDDYKPPSGMINCHCLPDCEHQIYRGEVSSSEKSNSSREIDLDVHFRRSTCILYRTNLMYNWINLLVSFGGCTGLFLGGSLLSCVELIYFGTIRLRHHWVNRNL